MDPKTVHKLDLSATFNDCKIANGDILCFQAALLPER